MNPFEGWVKEQQTRHVWAKDAAGKSVFPNHPAACSWCAQGWLFRQNVNGQAIGAFNVFLRAHQGLDAMALNDYEKWTPEQFRQAWEECFRDQSL